MKYLKYFKENFTYNKSINDNLKPIGISITKLASFNPSLNKIKRGVTPRDRYKIRYNFMNTVFKKLFTALYKKKYDITKLRWIYVDHPSNLGKQRSKINRNSFNFVIDPVYGYIELLNEILLEITSGNFAISYDDSSGVNKSEQIQDNLFKNILQECFNHIKTNKNLEQEDVYNIIANIISNITNNYSIIYSIKSDKMLWKKLAPYMSDGANDAATMGDAGFSD